MKQEKEKQTLRKKNTHNVGIMSKNWICEKWTLFFGLLMLRDMQGRTKGRERETLHTQTIQWVNTERNRSRSNWNDTHVECEIKFRLPSMNSQVDSSIAVSHFLSLSNWNLDSLRLLLLWCLFSMQRERCFWMSHIKLVGRKEDGHESSNGNIHAYTKRKHI